MYEFIIAGLVVGFTVGATGVGGGVLMTPLLLAMGVQAHAAIGTDLLFAFGSKSYGVALRRKAAVVNWRVVGLMSLGSVPASILTSIVLNDVGVANPETQRVMKISLGIAIALTAFMLFFNARITRFAQHSDAGILHALTGPLREPMTVVAGIVLGVLVTLSSVGAGVIGAICLLLLYPKLKAVEVVGTDLAHAVVLTLVAGIGHGWNGTIEWGMLAWLMVGSIPGMYLGTKLGLSLPERILRPALTVIILIAGSFVAYDAITSSSVPH